MARNRIDFDGGHQNEERSAYPSPPNLTPRNRAFLAGELYPPDKPYKQPKRRSDEERERGLKGVADARAALNKTSKSKDL